MNDLWREIDMIDSQITGLFEKRMALVADIVKFKEENNLPVLNAAREEAILARVTAGQSEEMAEYTKVLFDVLFAVSRSYQVKSYSQNSNP
jgi:chorismate mutase/prephenate dehydratase